MDWYPWGEEAFAKARRENKPIMLSIGYSTCYWCHVMEREVFENPEIVFYQMNGLMLGTWLNPGLAEDSQRTNQSTPGAFALAHNVPAQADVQSVMDRLARNGGKILRMADAPPHGGFRGYVADPDDHAWEIAWNPAWKIDTEGHVTFSL